MEQPKNLSELRKVKEKFGNPRILIVDLNSFMGLKDLISVNDWYWTRSGERAFWFEGMLVTYPPMANVCVNLTGVDAIIEEISE